MRLAGFSLGFGGGSRHCRLVVSFGDEPGSLGRAHFRDGTKNRNNRNLLRNISGGQRACGWVVLVIDRLLNGKSLHIF